jgi:hypothetical protein
MPVAHDDGLRRGELCAAQRSLGSATGIPLRFVFLGLRPSACWDWDWVTQGSPKGHARATQGSPKRRIEQMLCLQQTRKKAGWARKNWQHSEIGISKSKSLTTKVTKEHKRSVSKGTSQTSSIFCYFDRFYLI